MHEEADERDPSQTGHCLRGEGSVLAAILQNTLTPLRKHPGQVGKTGEIISGKKNAPVYAYIFPWLTRSARWRGVHHVEVSAQEQQGQTNYQLGEDDERLSSDPVHQGDGEDVTLICHCRMRVCVSYQERLC